jgi:hypothetical protein
MHEKAGTDDLDTNMDRLGSGFSPVLTAPRKRKRPHLAPSLEARGLCAVLRQSAREPDLRAVGPMANAESMTLASAAATSPAPLLEFGQSPPLSLAPVSERDVAVACGSAHSVGSPLRD